MEEGGGEMRFRLPAAPSPGQLLEWELGNAALEAFRCSGPFYIILHMPLLDECKSSSSKTARIVGV